MGSWDVFLRTEQHAHDYAYVNQAISALLRNRVDNAVSALGDVYTMEWGKYYSREVYLLILDQMVNCYMYWGDDFDQQQAYVDVQGVYLGLKDGSMSKATALNALISMRDTQLIPWYETDLFAMQSAWIDATGILDSVA